MVTEKKFVKILQLSINTGLQPQTQTISVIFDSIRNTEPTESIPFTEVTEI